MFGFYFSMDQQSFTFFSALLLGLIAGSSSCLAVSGGLLLSMVGKAHDRLGMMNKKMRMQFTVMFVFGRIASYTILGGVIGAIGSTFTFSSKVTGVITLIAAAYMLIAGLEMLSIAPKWMKCAIPRPPKWLSNRILDSDGHPNKLAPFLLGAATFFLPCGFTQSLQIYALTTGSFSTSAMILGAFSLGTAPVLIGIGFAAGAMKGKTGSWILKIAGAFILFLGITNVQNGLTLLGRPISFATAAPESGYRVVVPSEETGAVDRADNSDEDGVQQLRLTLINTAPYYAPSNSVSVRAGSPVRLTIDGKAGGCRSYFQISGLDVGLPLNKPKNIVEFTPKKPGKYTFSCSMGMYRGTLTVI